LVFHGSSLSVGRSWPIATSLPSGQAFATAESGVHIRLLLSLGIACFT
jgi:hypothetical protein